MIKYLQENEEKKQAAEEEKRSKRKSEKLRNSSVRPRNNSKRKKKKAKRIPRRDAHQISHRQTQATEHCKNPIQEEDEDAICL